MKLMLDYVILPVGGSYKQIGQAIVFPQLKWIA